MGLFKRGFEEVKKEKERQEEIKKNSGKKLWDFFVSGDGSEAEIVFLHKDPLKFWTHTVKYFKDGKEKYDSVTCSEDSSCPNCKDGDRATTKFAWLIVDTREYEYKDRDGKKVTGKNQIRLYNAGIKIASQLDRISSKYGLEGKEITVARLGTGTDTTYQFERGEKVNFSDKEIENMLPESLRPDFKGKDSIYDILENQLMMRLPQGVELSDNEDDDEEIEETTTIDMDDVEDEIPEKPKNKMKAVLNRKKK